MTPLHHTIELEDTTLDVHPLRSADEAEACARIMASSEPWVTLGRDLDGSRAVVADGAKEVYVVTCEGEDAADVAGFVILDLRGAFVGYVQTLAVREDWRGRGLGSRLLAIAEERIHRESPNVFICVSSFNPRARSLYERLGYEVVGELRDYLVRGHGEWLLRKTAAPLKEWRERRAAVSSPTPDS